MSLPKRYLKSKKSYKVNFRIIPPADIKVAEIRLLGDFNMWDWSRAPILKKVNNEYQTNMELEAGDTFEYRYLINQEIWLNDSYADQYVPSPFAGILNCAAVLPDYELDLPSEKKIDFTVINGIGPAISRLIVQAGVVSFEMLANTKVKDLDTILSGGGKRFKMHDPTDWPKQAKRIMSSAK